MKRKKWASQDIKNFFETLKNLFPNAKVELKRDTPFQLLLAVLLSAQATDKQVNKVNKIFFKYIKSPEDVLHYCDVSQWYECKWLEEQIKSIGLYKSKAKNIVKLSEILSKISRVGEKSLERYCHTSKCKEIYKEYGYIIPDKLGELTKLPGVGMKTAKVILNVLYWEDVVPVDTHIHRVANRLGWVNTKDPKKTSVALEKIIPKDYKQDAHKLLIFFGRYHCKAQNPKCASCPFKDICPFYLKQQKNDNSARSATN